MPPESDVVLAQQGDHEAFTRLIKGSEVTLYRVAKAFLPSDTECVEATQEAIVRAYYSLNTLREPKYFKTWLVRILINECKKVLTMSRKLVSITDLQEPAQPPAHPEERIVLQDAVNALDKEYRTVIVLFYYEDLPIKDIAELLELAPGTVKSRLSRAKANLARMLGDQQMEGCLV